MITARGNPPNLDRNKKLVWLFHCPWRGIFVYLLLLLLFFFVFVLFVQSYRNPRRDAGCWNQSSPDSSGTTSMKKSGEVFRGKCRFFLRGHTSVCFYHDFFFFFFFFLTSLGKSNKKLYLWEPLQILAFTILGHFRCVTSSGLAGLFYHLRIA